MLISLLSMFATLVACCDGQNDKRVYQGRYLILCPSTIRPGAPISLSVSLSEPLPDHVHLDLRLKDARNNTLSKLFKKTFKRREPFTLEIPPPKLGLLSAGRDYFVSVTAVSGGKTWLFEDQAAVAVSAKALAILVQTDKAKYKPGGAVKYRVVVLKPSLAPYEGSVSVRVVDPYENVLALSEKRPLDRGVLSEELPLSDEPPLGTWRIEATTDSGEKASKAFSVEKYVLPKFALELDLPAAAVKGDDLPVILRAKYTYGKPLDGLAKIEVHRDDSCEEDAYKNRDYYYDEEIGDYIIKDKSSEGKKERPGPLISESGELDADGEFRLTLNGRLIQRPCQDSKDKPRRINKLKISAEVIEELTGIVREVEEELDYEEDRYKLSLAKSSEHWKPGLPYTLTIKLRSLDGAPLLGRQKRRVRLRVEDSEGRGGEREVFVDADGTKTLDLDTPEKPGRITVSVYHTEDETNTNRAKGKWISDVVSIESALSGSPGSFISLTSDDTTAVAAGSVKRFAVRATKRIEQVSYVVLSRGLVLASGGVSAKGRSATIDLITTSAMAPTATLVVHSVRGDSKEVLVDRMDFVVEGIFANKVAVSLSASSAEPGDSVDIRVNCDRGSLVNVLGVDRSVRLLAKGNDITTDSVAEELQKFSGPESVGPSGIGDYDYPGRRRRKRSSEPFYPGPSDKDPTSVFRSAGLAVLTDAWVFEEPRSKPSHNGMVFVLPPENSIPPDYYNFEGGEYVDSGFEYADSGSYSDAGAGESARPEFPEYSSRPNNIRRPVKPKPKATVREDFPETWLWLDNKGQSSSGQTTFSAKVPDTISSFAVSAFAVSPTTGLGVAESPASLRVFRPFFAQLSLPYSVKRGEQLAVQVILFNYLSTAQSVVVTLAESGRFRFVAESGAVIKRSPGQASPPALTTRTASLKANGGSAAVYFPIVPLSIGPMRLEVSATGASARDRLRRNLLVEPEGFRVEGTAPLTIDLSKTPRFKKSLKADVPTKDPGFVRGSVRTKLSLIGDLMSPVLKNLGDLVRQPYGCGEQNMVNFVPNIVVVKYLRSTKRSDAALEAKALDFMKSGYQRELQYLRRDGSFSAFGEADVVGSTWLTAFVLRSFKQAQPYIYIDPDVVIKALGYLLSVQKRSGEYHEKHTAVHRELAGGGSESGVPLTAYVVVAMLESGRKDAKGLAYLERKLPRLRRPYTLALVTYALHLAQSSKKERAWKALQRAAQRGGGLKFWRGVEEKEDGPEYWSEPPPADVEMTAYALHSYVLRRATSSALPVVRWLIAKRNAQGGWSSTQDTVVALSALGEHGAKAYSDDFDVRLKLSNGKGKKRSFTVNPNNALKMQTYRARRPRSPVTVEASGKGTVYAQLSWSYHLKSDSANGPFACSVKEVPDRKAKASRNSDALLAELCCRYTRGESGMAVLEVEALSGFEFDAEAVGGLTELPDLQRAELLKSATQANVYFDKLTGKPKCFRLKSERVAPVAEQKPSQIRLYDYYRPQDRLEMKWSRDGRSKSLKDTCPECWPDQNAESGGARSLALPQNKCKDRLSRCTKLCRPSRLKSKAYQRYVKRNERFMKRNCQKSCARFFRLKRCFDEAG